MRKRKEDEKVSWCDSLQPTWQILERSSYCVHCRIHKPIQCYLLFQFDQHYEWIPRQRKQMTKARSTLNQKIIPTLFADRNSIPRPTIPGVDTRTSSWFVWNCWIISRRWTNGVSTVTALWETVGKDEARMAWTSTTSILSIKLWVYSNRVWQRMTRGSWSSDSVSWIHFFINATNFFFFWFSSHHWIEYWRVEFNRSSTQILLYPIRISQTVTSIGFWRWGRIWARRFAVIVADTTIFYTTTSCYKGHL